MPSLRALGEFKSSFNNIGGELETLAELDLPRDDLPLPDTEPVFIPTDDAAPPEDETISDQSFESAQNEPFPDAPESEGGGEGKDFIDFGDLGDLLGGMDNSANGPPAEAPDQEGVEFGEFIDAIPDDASDENVNLPPGLLNGLADELEAAVEQNGKEAFEDQDSVSPEPGEDLDLDLGEDFSLGAESPEEMFDLSDQEPDESLDLSDQESGESIDLSDQGVGDLPDFDSGEDLELSEETGEEASVDQDSFDLDLDLGEDFSLEAESPKEEFDLSDQEPDESADLQAEEPGESLDLSDQDTGDLPDFDSGEDLELSEETEPDDDSMELAGDDNLELGGEIQEFESQPGFDNEAVLEELPEDSFDKFSLDSGTAPDDFGLDEDDSESNSFGDDFALPGIDFDGKPDSAGKKASTLRSTGKNAARGRDDSNEISLTEEELDMFQKTLSSYPLNLRIACEEIIAEQVVAPELLSNLVDLLIDGAAASDTAALAGKILKRNIPIPKAFEKKTGEALEAEQSSFAYIFVHNFLPVLRLFIIAGLLIFSVGYLSWQFIYNPIKAEKIYKLGIERIEAGEYGRANERFREAFKIYEKKEWFYKYARAFREARQYTMAEEKYQELLFYTASKNKKRIPEKRAVLEYADLQTNSIGDYESADRILRRNILDYSPFDYDALLALGDNNLTWGEYESERLEAARESFAILMERHGRTDPLLERMLMYFIRTDNLGEVLPLQSYFMASTKRKISAEALVEMGSYLMDKRLEKVQGVPNEFLGNIGGTRDILFRAIRQNSMLPESYYQLARYYNFFDNSNDERLTLEIAVKVFEAVKEETPKRLKYHIYTLRRYAEVLAARREFFPAEEHLNKGIKLYQDGLSRRLIKRSPEFGRLYADLGDLSYFVKDGDMRTALYYYRLGEENGWAPPEIIYRMGAAHYQLREWGPSLDRLFSAYREMPPNRRILYALGNVSYMRGNYFAAQGYYDRLLEILESDRVRLPPIMPTNDEEPLDLAERLMVAQNNLGVTLEVLTANTGNSKHRSRAQGLYSDSGRAWDILTRNPKTMIRMRPSPDITAPGINPAYLNVQNSLHPVPGYEYKFFLRIDMDVLEPSEWEELAPPGYRLSEGISIGR